MAQGFYPSLNPLKFGIWLQLGELTLNRFVSLLNMLDTDLIYNGDDTLENCQFMLLVKPTSGRRSFDKSFKSRTAVAMYRCTNVVAAWSTIL